MPAIQEARCIGCGKWIEKAKAVKVPAMSGHVYRCAECERAKSA